MNTMEPEKIEAQPPRDSKKPLLDAVQSLRTCVGEGLNDVEFTHFLQKASLPAESGFEFLSYSNRFVTLSVPKQETGSWYRDKGWVIEEKEQRAREIARKYGLSLYHPPDAVGTHHVTPQSDASHPCHHLEMSFDREILVVIHPLYLKIRMSHASGTSHHASGAHRAPHPGSEMLKDLSTLYQHQDPKA
jgi:hypothetical protein